MLRNFRRPRHRGAAAREVEHEQEHDEVGVGREEKVT